MEWFTKIKEKQQAKKEIKKQQLRIKNAALRAKGIKPIKPGWGKMVNTGSGGLNNLDASNKGKLAEFGFRTNEGEEIAKENTRKKVQDIYKK